MVTYRYTAKDARGRTVRGTARADDTQALYLQLRSRGLFLVGQRADRPPRLRPLSSRQLAAFCQGLGALLTAGVPLVRALEILEEEQDAGPAERQICRALQQSLRGGEPLSAAMTALGPAFPPLLPAMVRSAEGRGDTGRICRQMADYYEKEAAARQQVLNSLLYPAVLAGMVVLVTAVLVGFVMPRFADLFAGLETLPRLTLLLLGICRALADGWPWLLLGLAAAGAAGRRRLHRPRGRRRTDRLLLRLPGIGRLCRQLCSARFARTLAALYAGGIPILTALQAARDTVRNAWIADQFPRVLAAVGSGTTLSTALAGLDGFEKRMTAALQVGEETGRLDEMLTAAADTLDQQAQTTAKRLLSLLEPLTILVMGAVVALVVLAVMLPIYSSYSVLAG